LRDEGGAETVDFVGESVDHFAVDDAGAMALIRMLDAA
jgi:hypothetical protein